MINLKNFNLLKEDEEHYTVGHPEGKQLKVKKSGLNEKAHALVKKLPKYAEGGFVEETDFIPDVVPEIPPYLKPNEPELGMDAAAKYFENDQSATQPIPENAEQIIEQQPVVGQTAASNVANNDLIRKATQAGMTVDEYVKKESNNDIKSIDSAVASAAPSVKTPDIDAKEFGSGYESEKSGIKKEAEALKQKGLEEVAASQEVEQKIASMPTQEEIFKRFQDRDQALLSAYESKMIDPDRYIKNRDTGTKLQQGIALILGGIGSGLTGGPNVVLNMIHKKIEDDIQSQKTEKESAFNLWKMNKEALGDELSANLATQNQIYTGLKFKLAQAASRSDSQVAMGRAEQAIAKIDQAIGQNRMKLSLLQSSDNGSEADTVRKMSALKLMAPEIAKEKEEKYIPGVGMASVKPTDKDRDTLSKADQAIKDVVELQALATQGPTMKGSQASVYNKSKMTSLMLKLKDIENLGVLAGPDMELLQDLVPNPGNLYSPSTIRALQATKQSIEGTKKSISDKLGIKPFQKPAEIKTMGGVEYIRVPGGWQKAQ